MFFSSSKFEFSTFPVGVGWVSSPGNKANLAKLELDYVLQFAILYFMVNIKIARHTVGVKSLLFSYK